MSTPRSLPASLAKNKILLANNSGKLKYRAQKHALDSSLKEQLQASKEKILTALQPYQGYCQLSYLSKNQESLYLAQQLDPKGFAYNLALTVSIRGLLSEKKLADAINQLADEHPQICSHYDFWEDDALATPYQIIPENRSLPLVTINAQHWQNAELVSHIQDYYSEPINLKVGPVSGARLYQKHQKSHVLVLKFHHIALDAWSLKVLSERLNQLYLNPSPSQASHEPNYLDFCIQQNEELLGGTYNTELNFWRKHLTPAPQPLSFTSPTKTATGVNEGPSGATHYFEIPQELKSALITYSRETGASTAAVTLAAFQALLMKKGKRRDLVIGLPTLGNRTAEYSETVGYFVNPLPIRAVRNSNITWQAHIENTSDELAKAMECRHVPLTAITEGLNTHRGRSKNPVFQSMFNFLPPTVLGDVTKWLYPWKNPEPSTFLGLDASPFAINQQEAQFTVTLEIIDSGTQWLGLLKYDCNVLSQNEIVEWESSYLGYLSAIINEPNTRVLNDEDSEELLLIAVFSTFTADPLLTPLSRDLEKIGYATHIQFGPYNQVFQSLLDPSSTLRQNAKGINILLIRLDDIAPAGSHKAEYEKVCNELHDTILSVAPRLASPLIVTVAKSSPQLSAHLGSYEQQITHSLESALAAIPGIYCVPQTQIQDWYTVEDFYEPTGEQLAHIPYTRNYFDALGAGIGRSIYGVTSAPIKAIAIDCDGTLWEGIVGEQGVANIQIGDKQREFQSLLVKLHLFGIVLCLCSKNEEADVWSVFDQRRDDMILRKEHISFWRINWKPKSSNIQALAHDINISTSAFAFLDDSLIEREEVSQQLPEVLTIDFPLPWSERIQYLKQFWPLDLRKSTKDDSKRNEHYRSEKDRLQLKHTTTSWQDFIQSLNLKITIEEATQETVPRLSQLTYRTNQFNTTLLRMKETDVVSWLEDSTKRVWTVSVSDRFGDYGLVGAIFATHNEKQLQINNLLLSCRALGRTVEYAMASFIGKFAVENAIESVYFEFKHAERNEPANQFIGSLQHLCTAPGIDPNDHLCNASSLAVIKAPEPVETSNNSLSNEQNHSNPNQLTLNKWHPGFDEIATSWLMQNKNTPITATSDNGASISQHIKRIWEDILKIEITNLNNNFFDLGGNSLLLAQTAIAMNKAGFNVSLIELYQFTTILEICQHLSSEDTLNVVTQISEDDAQRYIAVPYQRLREFRGFYISG